MVRIAVLADLHGNVPATEAVLADLERQGVDEVLVGGDLVGRGPQGSAVVQRIAATGWRSVRGNHEDYLLTRAGASDSETFNSHVCPEENFQREYTRYIVLPWVLAATRDAYAEGTLRKRRETIALVQRLGREQDALIAETKQENFVAAELVIALRHLRENYLAAAPTPAQETPESRSASRTP